MIQGCYLTGSGKLRVIDAEAGETCTDRETAISFLGVSAKAADADKLDGKDSAEFLTSGDSKSAYGPLVVTDCNEASPVSYPLTLAKPSRIYAQGNATVIR